jgi:threonine synthase
VASNFERYLYYHFQGDSLRLRAFMESFAETGSAALGAAPSTDDFLATAVSEAETLAAIEALQRDFGYVVDPHTAIGLVAAERFATRGPKVCVATAHPAKFPAAVEQAVGAPVHHARLDSLHGAPQRMAEVPADISAIKAVIAEQASA